MTLLLVLEVSGGFIVFKVLTLSAKYAKFPWNLSFTESEAVGLFPGVPKIGQQHLSGSKICGYMFLSVNEHSAMCYKGIL